MALRTSLTALAGAAAIALFAGQAFAQTVTTSANLTKTFTEDVDVDVDNTVNVNISKEIDVTKDVNYVGTVVISGNLNVSEAALTTIDNKQIIDDGSINVGVTDASLTNLVDISGAVLGGASGNIGVNVSSGDSLLQENVAALSAIGTTAAAGSSDAEVFSVQKGVNNSFDDSVEPSEILNQVTLLGDVLMTANGNVGLNAATGAFNGQKNALSIAAVSGSATLSEATAAVLQESSFNSSIHNSTANDVKLQDNVANAASGNIGLNLTSGAHNFQNNTLAISSVQ